MKILIQRFTLCHDGEEYEPGDVLEVDDATGARLIKNARGAIVEIKEARKRKKDKPVTPKTETPPLVGNSERQDEAKDEPDKEATDREPGKELESAADEGEPEAEEDDTPIELPSADPATAVKPKRGGRKK